MLVLGVKISELEFALQMDAVLTENVANGFGGAPDFAVAPLQKLSKNFPSLTLVKIFIARFLTGGNLYRRGVRCVQVYHTQTAKRSSYQLWDQHGGLREELPNNCAATDKPIAGLLKDLKSRGLLDETLVLWGGEFGRTPTAEGDNGREHHPFGFTMWMAGGGVRGGLTYGATDEFGWHATENPVHVHDLHATILYLMGVNHEKLTYRYAGRDYRLTDVYGNVVRDIIA